MIRRKLVLFVCLRVAVVGAGAISLLRYENTAGAPSTAPTLWPARSLLLHDAAQPTLLLFVHPRCPCTRATIEELAQLMTRVHGRAAVAVVFTKPPDAKADWFDSDLWGSTSAIPGVRLVRDQAGLEARRFGASTSGAAMLYAIDGRLLFQGGITSGRGHVGDNEGRSAILALIDGAPARTPATPVFGCPLFKAVAPPDCHT